MFVGYIYFVSRVARVKPLKNSSSSPSPARWATYADLISAMVGEPALLGGSAGSFLEMFALGTYPTAPSKVNFSPLDDLRHKPSLTKPFGDFRAWNDDGTYSTSFHRLLRELQAGAEVSASP